MHTNDIDRRTALRGAAVVAAGVTLAACGSESGTTAAGATPDPTSIASVIGDVSPIPSATEATASNAAAAENGLGNAAAVQVGGGVIFQAQKVVVTQPTAGKFKAFTAVCTHQGCLVGSVANGAITCPCHGSSFSIKDGSVISGPATAPLKEEKVTASGGTLKLG